jgi:hypothetical protein
VLGLGKAANSPAGQAIARAFGRLLGTFRDPERALALGLAKNQAKADRIVTMARAQAEAREIAAASDARLERMKARVVANELRRQSNLEEAITLAIEHVEAADQVGEAREIHDDFFAKWTEGAQEVSANHIRELWARVLESQSIASRPSISRASLNLLEQVDGETAEAFTEFCRWMLVYGCYPLYSKMDPEVLTRRNINLLSEIGFTRIDERTGFGFNECLLQYDARVTFRHTQLVFTERGLEIAKAVFPEGEVWGGPLSGREPELDEVLVNYKRLIDRMIGVHESVPIALQFKTTDEKIAYLRFQKGEPRPCEEVVGIVESAGVRPSQFLSSLFREISQTHFVLGVFVRGQDEDHEQAKA